ncbi:AmmeMemoRadiSam system protein B [bacterium]|nr:AmmeMemoRadiSam system protein B [bacterium]
MSLYFEPLAGYAEKNSKDLPIISLKESFYDKQSFWPAVKAADKIRANSDIPAIVVPHHLVPSEYIARMLKRASGRQVDQVVIIGPNHNNIGVASIASVKASWQTPFGAVDTHVSLADDLLFTLGIKENFEAFDNEHAVGAIVPFVKYYLPQAKVVPVLLSSYAETSDAEKLAKWLNNNLPDNSLIIFSIDFSHYLSKEEADRKDIITRELIWDRDINRIMGLNNDYVDSPASLITGLMYANYNNLKINIEKQGNSFDFLLPKPSETTSYFAISFIKE